MMNRARGIWFATAATLMMAGSALADPAALKALDPDNDGTIDLAEAQAGGTKIFTALDPDKDGTLDERNSPASWTPQH